MHVEPISTACEVPQTKCDGDFHSHLENDELFKALSNKNASNIAKLIIFVPIHFALINMYNVVNRSCIKYV